MVRMAGSTSAQDLLEVVVQLLSTYSCHATTTTTTTLLREKTTETTDLLQQHQWPPAVGVRLFNLATSILQSVVKANDSGGGGGGGGASVTLTLTLTLTP